MDRGHAACALTSIAETPRCLGSLTIETNLDSSIGKELAGCKVLEWFLAVFSWERVGRDSSRSRSTIASFLISEGSHEDAKARRKPADHKTLRGFA